MTRQSSEFTWPAVSAAFASAFGVMLASGTAVIGTFGMFMLPVTREFGWGRAEAAAGVSIMSITTAFCSPFVGRLLDRWGVRRVVLPGFVAYAVAVMLLSFASAPPLLFYLSYVLVGVPAALISIVPYFKTVSAWFDRRRGMVLALVGLVAAIGGSQMPVIANLLVQNFGWRGAYVGIGLVILGVGFPVLLLFLREPHDRAHTSAAAGAPPAAAGMEARAVRRDREYHRLIAIQLLITFSSGGILAHLAPMMVDRGHSPAQAAWALSLAAIGGTGGRLLVGVLLDRFGTPRVALPFAAGAVVGAGLLTQAQTMPAFLVAGVLISACSGAEGELAPYLHSRYFGLKAFAETFGLQFLFLALANGVGITVAGAVFDRFGSYQGLLWADLVLYLLALTFFLRLGAFRYAPHATPIENVETPESLPPHGAALSASD